MTLPPEQDFRLYMVTREPFDPSDAAVPPEHSTPSWYIVQFVRPLTLKERNRLRETFGLQLRDYLPHFAYIEFLAPETWLSLSHDELYRASLLYEPTDKISPGIAEPFDANADSERLLRAVLFPNANLKAFLDALSAMFPSVERRESDSEPFKVLDDRDASGDLKVVFPSPSGENLLKLAQSKDVRWIEEAAEISLNCPAISELTPGGLVQSGTPDLTPVWNRGIQGQKQVIGVTDSSIDISHCMFLDSNTVGPNHRKLRGQRQLSFIEDNLHGQTVAALAAGHDPSGPSAMSRGMAWEATLSLDDSERVNTYAISLLSTFLNQDSEDAFIHSNSFHDSGGYNQIAAEVDSFLFEREEHFVCGSSGNSSEPPLLGSPGSAKNALCVSATRGYPRHLEFGDGIPGPISNEDLRFKPDICAPGGGIRSAGAHVCAPVSIGRAASWATPIVAGAAALVRQYYREGWYPTGTRRAEDEFARPSGALLKATLLNSTVQIISNGSYPARREGWGLVRLTNTLFFAEEGVPKLFVRDISNAAGLHTNESHTYRVTIRDDSRPLKITLVWSDSPGLASASQPLVNNLNLIVTSPNRMRFLGNQFDGMSGLSVEGGTPDNINNVEMVIRDKELGGDWTITVCCEAANGRTMMQGYALVVTGALS